LGDTRYKSNERCKVRSDVVLKRGLDLKVLFIIIKMC